MGRREARPGFVQRARGQPSGSGLSPPRLPRALLLLLLLGGRDRAAAGDAGGSGARSAAAAAVARPGRP